jgi:hypothetical protein
MVIVYIFVLSIPFAYRIFQLQKFLKNISRVCHMYDWKCVDENPEEYLLEIINEKYYVGNEWSAYNFLFLKGPSPLQMYFSFKPFELDNFYKKNDIEKIKNKITK